MVQVWGLMVWYKVWVSFWNDLNFWTHNYFFITIWCWIMNRRTHLQLWITKFGVNSQFYLLVTPVAFHLHHANLQQQVEQPNFQVIAQSFNQIGVTCNTTSTEMAKLGHLPLVADGAVILTAIDNFTTQVAAVDNCLGEGLKGIMQWQTIVWVHKPLLTFTFVYSLLKWPQWSKFCCLNAECHLYF